MQADYHIHTNYSNDSCYAMEDVVLKAIQLGIDEICFTEHSDYGTMGDYVVHYDNYYQHYLEMKERYNDKIILKFGCEFGVQMHTIPSYINDFQQYPFDFIILSNHQIDDIEFWTYEYQKGKSQKEYNFGYYQAIYNVIQNFNNYSVLGHLDMIKRYDQLGSYHDQDIEDILTKILKHIIKEGKGIEVNTSCFRYQLPDLTPSRDILTLYYRLGGTIVTIGSDTHEEQHLGESLEYAKQQLKDIGFQYFCTFEKMRPIFHQL